MAKYHVGVDVGKDRHHVCILDLSRDTYYKTFSITNDHDGFIVLVHSLEKLPANKDDFLVSIEAYSYGINLSYFLMGVVFNLVEVNPFRAGQFRKAEGKKVKTDRIDARSIAAKPMPKRRIATVLSMLCHLEEVEDVAKITRLLA